MGLKNMNVNDLIKMADLLDTNGKFAAANEIDDVILTTSKENDAVLSPETLQEMKNSVDKMNDNIEDTIKFLQSQGYLVVKLKKKANLVGLKSVFEKLAQLSDHLDTAGAKDEADMIDSFVYDHAQHMDDESKEDVESFEDEESEGLGDLTDEMEELQKEWELLQNYTKANRYGVKKQAYDVDWKEEDDTEQSKRYDSKHHHSILIREPKRDQERMDFEGTKEHHIKPYASNSYALSTRHCPDHMGSQLSRVGEGIYQCSLDGKVYNWEMGFKDYQGNEHPGGSVAGQTPNSDQYTAPHRIFDTRK